MRQVLEVTTSEKKEATQKEDCNQKKMQRITVLAKETES